MALVKEVTDSSSDYDSSVSIEGYIVVLSNFVVVNVNVILVGC